MESKLPEASKRINLRQWVRFALALALALTAFPSPALAADTTPPTAPGQPKEGSPSVDYDFDADGSYGVYWPAARDPQSGIAAYRVQERIGVAGSWITLTSARTIPNWPVGGRLDKKTYYYRAQARNGAGLWGPFSPASDGILIDKTPPSQGAVTDDGAWTASTSTLRAAWTAGSDPESRIAQYEYLIRQDSTLGTILVNYTSVGLNLEVARTGLSLIHGKKYFIGIRAKNGAGLFSIPSYSDGIWINEPPEITAVTPADGSSFYPPTAIPCTVAATDPSGDTLQCRFLMDGQVVQDWSSSNSYSLNPGSFPSGLRTLRMEVKDPWEGMDGRTVQIDLFRKPLEAKE